MSHPAHVTGPSHESRCPVSAAEVEPSEAMANNDSHGAPPSPSRRSDLLRHVLQRHPSSDAARGDRSSQMHNLDRTKHTLSSITYSKPRVAFKNFMSSLLPNTPPKISAEFVRTNSGGLSNASRVSSFHGSINSLDVVSPGTFLFSGPSLKSARSGSCSTPRSQLPSWAESSSETLSLHRKPSSPVLLDRLNPVGAAILEPYVERGITRSLSDVLLGNEMSPDGFSHEVPATVLGNNNITGVHQGVVSPNSLTEPNIPAEAMTSVARDCKALLANELLSMIYDRVSVRSFRAVRHTCTKWYAASTEPKLLKRMLKEGGWWNVAKVFEEVKDGLTRAWLYNGYLSRELALSADFNTAGSSPFPTASETDFSDLANGYYSHSACDSRTTLIYTTSVCGRFLLVARECLIFVYDLRENGLRPLTSIPCPRRALSMTMDVTIGRYAVAALLEGRLGMVCELQFVRDHHGEDSPVQVCEGIREGYRQEGIRNFSPATHATETTFNAVDIQANNNAISLQDANDHRAYSPNCINHSWNIELHGVPLITSEPDARSKSTANQGLPIESSTSTFYRRLFREDDPPRSVAICPQRRCVAFGGSSGVELYWVDALTNQSLTRYFPLTAPSDYLCFLAPRPGFESAKKLRLISSVAHPNDRPAVSRKFLAQRPSWVLPWDSYAYQRNNFLNEPFDYDHYHAVPLSDGHHVMFTDPSTAKLFIGCDAPLGSSVKLLRKIHLAAPRNGKIPRIYRAAADLTWGARIAVSFEGSKDYKNSEDSEDTLVFYNVPPDMLAFSESEQRNQAPDTAMQPNVPSDLSNEWFSTWQSPQNVSLENSASIWPVTIRGSVIGKLAGTSEIGIFTHPELTIWAFSTSGRAITWRVKSLKEGDSQMHYFTCLNGLVHSSPLTKKERNNAKVETAEQCRIKGDLAATSLERFLELDGNSVRDSFTLLPKALSLEQDTWVDSLGILSCNAWYDMDGDVAMLDVDEHGDSGVECLESAFTRPWIGCGN